MAEEYNELMSNGAQVFVPSHPS